MCYISDWPKRFLKTILLQLSRHQVCIHTHTDTHRWLTPCGVDRTTGERNSVCQGLTFSSGSAVRSRMAPDVCPFLQVELLIENEAEKDYLYDVLRMYHQ